MIKICHMTSAHKRYDVRIFEKECSSLVNAGYDTTLLVNDNLDNDITNGVKIISTGVVKTSRIKRILLSQKNMKKRALALNAHIYHFHDPELLFVGYWLKKKGKKVIFDCHEDVCEQIKDKDWIPSIFRGTVSSIYKIIQNHVIKRIDVVITVTPHLVEKLEKFNPNTIMVTNYPIVDENIRERNPKNNICFAGGISAQWCHELIIDALNDIDGVKYLLAGNSENNYFSKLKDKSGWKNVEYLGKIDHKEVKELYNKSFAGMAINYSSQAKGIGTLGNTKLFEYMEAELPVICTDYKLWKKVIEENKCGICVKHDNIQEIKNAIDYIKEHKEEAEIMGYNGRKAVLEKFNWAIEEEKLISVYESLIK